eukprot:456776_1
MKNNPDINKFNPFAPMNTPQQIFPILNNIDEMKSQNKQLQTLLDIKRLEYTLENRDTLNQLNSTLYNTSDILINLQSSNNKIDSNQKSSINVINNIHTSILDLINVVNKLENKFEM